MFLLVPLPFERASLVAQTVKNLPAIQETWVPSLGQEDPLGKGMATHSSIPAWKIPEEEEGYSPWGQKESDKTKWLTLSFLSSFFTFWITFCPYITILMNQRKCELRAYYRLCTVKNYKLPFWTLLFWVDST